MILDSLLIFSLLYNIEIGITPKKEFALYKDNIFTQQYSNPGVRYYSNFSMFIKNKYMFSGGSIKIAMNTTLSNSSFYPKKIDFDFEAGLILSKNIKMGFKHFCTHPLAPYVAEIPKPFLNGAYEEIYLKVSNF